MSIRYANLPASPRSREKPMPAAKAPPIELSSDHERQLKALARAHSTPQKLAERYASSCSPRMAGRERDGRGTRYLAQDSRPLAPPLAGGGNLRGRGRASERRATFRRAGHLHAGQICQIHDAGLRRLRTAGRLAAYAPRLDRRRAANATSPVPSSNSEAGSGTSAVEMVIDWMLASAAIVWPLLFQSPISTPDS